LTCWRRRRWLPRPTGVAGRSRTGEYARRFSLSLARKDAELITEAAAAAGVDLPLADIQRRRFSEAERAGWGEGDYSAVIGWLRRPRSHHRPVRTIDPAKRVAELAFDGLIIDLDGVVWIGGEPVAGSVAALAELRARQIPLVFLTNDPTHSRAGYAVRLAQIGVAASEGQIVTSATALASLIGDEEGEGTKTFVIGSSSLKQELQQDGLEIHDGEEGREVDVVAVGGHAGFNYDELRVAAQAIRGGARLYAAGRDATFPMPDGPWPATGSILAALETAAGVRATVAGKPEPYIYALARSVLADRHHVAVIGDHLEADIAGGKRAGLATILVLSGTTSAHELDAAEVEPDVVLDDLAGLLQIASVSR
jgi:glycerol 3-phosphatase-2